ncbi:MAG TPA: hypothetical protein VJR23_08700 [Candidatus Acidoferrales bacterium]|nr:hypothetical protein [Candidatus Acidoferrales bacterium]
MGQVTHEQVNLMLRLYDTRREPRLREAREWFLANFAPQNSEELMRIAPPMTQENAFLRMVVSYWDMVASIVNRGLIDEDFFFENTGEQWLVWERLKPVVEFWRAMFKNPTLFKNLEEHFNRFEAWREKRAPGTNEAVRSVMKQVREAALASRTRTAAN